MILMKLVVLFVFSFFSFLGCASKKYTDTRSIRTIAATSKIHGLRNAGYVTAKDCSWSFLGLAASRPSYSDAFENAISMDKSTLWQDVKGEFTSNPKFKKFKIKLLNNIQTDQEGWNLYVLGKQCLKLRAVAYY